jgi:hypothetical protein
MEFVLGQAPAVAAASSAAEAAESASSAASSATAAAVSGASAGASAAAAAASASSAAASASASAPKTRLIATGTGLAGGGDLTADRTLSIAASGVGTAQLANDAASNAKLTDMPPNTIKGNNAAAPADPKDLTVAEVKSLLNLAGTNSGDQTIALTGDVAGSGTGSFAATIAANAVSNAKLADMPSNRIKGNNSGASADPADLTPAEVGAMLPAMAGDAGSGGAKGLVPAPAAGDAGKFLRGDGSWSAVAGAGWILARITVISASTTWTKPPALKAVLARAVGGGGGGGYGVVGSAGGGGGGGGGYSEKLVLAASLGSSETVTIGAGGSGGTSGAGGAGGSTSFGAHLSATGGAGGAGGGSTALGGLGGTGSGGTINVDGGAGGAGYAIPIPETVYAMAGDGGWAANGLGPGARTVVTGIVGNAGKNYGGGGGGGLGTSLGRNGGAGAPGVVILYEYE